MPVTPTYPGVYINELPSAVHTIIGVPTSVAAFVGPAARGPANVAVQINSWADFERTFGGLAPDSEMSYGVYQFFLNGGATAQVVRATASSGGPGTGLINVVGTAPADNAASPPPTFLALDAASPGSWANNLEVTITASVPLSSPTATKQDAAADPPANLETYDLTITDTSPNGATETYLAVSTKKGDTRSIDNQLRSSALVTLHANSDPTAQPQATTAALKVASTVTDGTAATPMQLSKVAKEALATVDIFNMLCVPDAAASIDWTKNSSDYTGFLKDLVPFCVDRRAMMLIDPPADWAKDGNYQSQLPLTETKIGMNAAFYYPRVSILDQVGGVRRLVGNSGTMAGVYAATDAARGVWKAPAGTTASLSGVIGLEKNLTDADSGTLNPLGVNVLRNFPIYGPVSWGARTTNGADQATDQWKYVPIRRLALFIEESLFRGTKWVVFEPNDEPLWSSIRLNVGAFMNGLYRQGAFQGSTPQQAYLVKCDADTNPQSSIDQGIVNILVGFAPLKPAEFVFINIEQLAGNLAG